MKRRHVFEAAACLAVCAASMAIGVHLGGGSRLIAVTVSPDGREQVEEYGPTRWQSLTALHRREIPGFLRLVNRADGRPIGGDSPIVDLDDSGTPSWNKGDVYLNVIARFSRKTGRWESYENLTRGG